MSKSGAKGRKIGNKKKQPAMKRYTAERRWERNKRKRIERHEREMAKKLEKLKMKNMAKGS